MKIVFLRHGKAEDRSADQSDAERQLTPEGKVEMTREASGMRALQFRFDRILSSPLPRALQTAKIVADKMTGGSVTVEVHEDLSAGQFGLEELQALLNGSSGDKSVLLVGHEPDFSSTVRQLTGAQIELKKGSAACVEAYRLEPDACTLRWLLTPRQLIAADHSKSQTDE